MKVLHVSLAIKALARVVAASVHAVPLSSQHLEGVGTGAPMEDMPNVKKTKALPLNLFTWLMRLALHERTLTEIAFISWFNFTLTVK